MFGRSGTRLLVAALAGLALQTVAAGPARAQQGTATGAGAVGGAGAGAGAGAVAGTDGGIVIKPYGPQYGYRDGQDGSRFVWVFLDGVEAVQGARTIRADTLVVILAADPAGGPPAEAPADAPAPSRAAQDAGVFFGNERLLELFADGNVSVVEGDEIISGARSFLLDNTTGVATVVEGELLTTARGEPLVIRYELLHRLQDGSSELQGLTASSCTYEHPHWHLRMPHATLTPTPEGRILDADSSTVRVGGLPVLWLPGFRLNVDRDSLLIRKLRIGSRSRYGTVIGTGWGGDAAPLATGLARAFGVTSDVAAQWELEADWYSRRGLFVEPSLEYHTAASKGRLLLAFIHDRADEDHLGQPIDDAARGRLRLQHRTRIDAAQTVDVEVSRQGDRNFLNEYYESEFKEGKEQETYVSYRNVVDNHAFTVLASTRLNDFDTQVEYLPQVVRRDSGRALGPVLFGDAFLTMRDFISNARLLPDDATADPSLRNLRAGSAAEIAWPLDLPNGDRVRVLAGADVTGFEDTVADGGELRTSATGGVAWSRTYSGSEPAHDETWNIDGVRRIVEPFAGYFNRFALSHDPDELLPIDAIERERRVETLTLGVRDRIQTHQDGHVATILDTELSLPVYAKANRDNGGESLGPLALDTRWAPHANLPVLEDMLLHWRAGYDTKDNHYDSSYASLSTSLGQGRRLRITQSAVFHEFNFVTLAVEWMLNDKWTAATFYQQDTRTQQRVKQGFLLRQKAHCWFIDYEVSQRRGESAVGADKDEVRASISFQPVVFDAEQDLTNSIGGRYP